MRPPRTRGRARWSRYPGGPGRRAVRSGGKSNNRGPLRVIGCRGPGQFEGSAPERGRLDETDYANREPVESSRRSMFRPSARAAMGASRTQGSANGSRADIRLRVPEKRVMTTIHETGEKVAANVERV